LPKVVLPERPCAPTLPAAYQGPSIDYWTGPGASDISHTAQEKNNTFKAKKYGWLGRTAVGSSINSGFIMASNDTAVNSAANLMFSGHTFGLYGQGQASMPQNGTAFEFNVDLHNAASAVQNTHSMMISLFPYDGTD